MPGTDEMGKEDQATPHDSGKVRTSDGLDLFWQCWLPNDPSGVLVLIHGLADHSNRYAETARHFARQGWAVYACDLRGHGLSPDGHRPGRVHVDDFSDYANDVAAVLALEKQRHPDLPHVILGHSMGGLVALRYAIDHPDELDGLVLSSPLLGTHPDARPPKLLHLLVRVLVRIHPRMFFPSDIDTDAISRDPDVVRAYIDDPLVSEKVSARWYIAINKAMTDIQGRAAELQIPTLLMQSGADRLVDPQAARDWAVGAPAAMLELVVWDGLYHEMFNEPEKGRVQARVLDWLSNNIS